MSKEYTLIGGNGTVVSPLEVTESGTYKAGDSRAFNPVKVNVPSGSSTLSGLTGVDISNPSDGQTLVYNATSGKWENGSGGGGSSGIIVVHVVEIAGTENVRLDKTWQEIWDAQTAGMIVAISEGQTGDSYAYWSCCPILEVSCDTSYGLWTVMDGSNSSTFNCLAPTDYPQTGIST